MAFGALTRARIKARIADKPNLIPVYSNVYNIPERLNRMDKSIFVVFNTYEQRYEIHCLNNIGDTFAFITPFGDLDSRTEEYYHRTNLRTRGMAIIREMDEKNEAHRRRKKKKSYDRTTDLGKELYPHVKKMAYWGA